MSTEEMIAVAEKREAARAAEQAENQESAAAKKITHFKYYTLLLLRGLEGSIIHDNLHYLDRIS